MKCPDRNCSGKLKVAETREMKTQVSRVLVCLTCKEVYSSKEVIDKEFNHPGWAGGNPNKNVLQYGIFNKDKDKKTS